jgi:hypothetical protein
VKPLCGDNLGGGCGGSHGVGCCDRDPARAGDPGGATEARAALEALLRGGEIRLERNVADRDELDRRLRYVFVGEPFVNEELVRLEWAEAKPSEPDTAMADRLAAAETEATTRAVGLWEPPPSTTTTALPATTTTEATATTAEPECHPSYEGECVLVGVEDVDCVGGEGNGPLLHRSGEGGRPRRGRARPRRRRHRLRGLISR